MSENQIILRTSCWTLTCIDLLIYKTINVQGGSDPLPTINRGNLAFRTFKTYLNLGDFPRDPPSTWDPLPMSASYTIPTLQGFKNGYGSSLGPMSLGVPEISLEPCEQCFQKNRGWLGYLGDYTSHLYRDCSKYNKPTNKDPYEPASISWNVKQQVGFDHCLCWDSHHWKQIPLALRAAQLSNLEASVTSHEDGTSRKGCLSSKHQFSECTLVSGIVIFRNIPW